MIEIVTALMLLTVAAATLLAVAPKTTTTGTIEDFLDNLQVLEPAQPSVLDRPGGLDSIPRADLQKRRRELDRRRRAVEAANHTTFTATFRYP